MSIHTLSLLQSPEHIATSYRLLDAEERHRADSFHFAHDRRRFIASHGALRTVISERLGIAPREVRLSHGRWGKPQLSSAHASRVSFNLSHSEELALLVVAEGRAVGVDIEAIRPLPELESISRTCFSHMERGAILAAAGDLRNALFFRYWTLKEAWIKATGRGLGGPLTGFEACDVGGGGLRIREVSSGRLEPWLLDEWVPAPGYVAAVAVEKPARVEEGLEI